MLAAYPTLASQLSPYCLQREVRSSVQLLPGGPSIARAPRLNPGDASVELDGGVSERIGYGSGLTPAGDDYLFVISRRGGPGSAGSTGSAGSL